MFGLAILCSNVVHSQQSAWYYPKYLDRWTGSVYNILGICSRIEGDDIYIGLPSRKRGWAKFDLTKIPDNSIITEADLKINVSIASNEPSAFELVINPLSIDPVTADLYNLWDEIDKPDYYQLFSTWGDATGTKTVYNFTVLESDIQSSLSKNWFAVGFYEKDEDANECKILGSAYIDDKPGLKIYFNLPAPANVSATDGSYCDKVRITWSAVTNADGYKIFKDDVYIGQTTSLYYDDFEASITSKMYEVHAFTNEASGHSSLSGGNYGYKGNTPGATLVTGGGTQCGGSIVLSISGGTGGTIYDQGITSNGTSISSPVTSGTTKTVSTSGTYYYRAKSSAGCWGEQGSATVTINPVPTNTVVTGGGSYPGSATLTASGGTGGTIYFQGTTSNGTSTATPANSRTVTASGTYYFRSGSTAGCWGEQGSAAVTITSGSGIGSVTGKTPLCIGESAEYTANNVVLDGGTGGWSTSNSLIATVSSTGVVTGVSPGSCNIIYTITGGTSGTVSEQQQVTISPDADIASISGPVNWCIGGVGNYTALPANLSGGTGAWSSSNSSIISISSSGAASAVSAGQANIIFTVTGGCGGTISKSQAITVSSGKAISSVTGLKSICVNTTVAFVANGVVTAGGQAAWSSSDVTVASVTQAGAVTGLSAGTCNIIYTISGGCGETVSSQQSLSVTPKPVGGTVTLSICSDKALDYNLQTNVNTLGNSVPSAFTWIVAANPEVTGATASTNASGIIIADRLRNISGSDKKVVYTITPTGSNGCKGEPFTLTVTIKPEPAGANDPVVTCSDNALDYDLQEDNISLKGNGVPSTFAWTTVANPEMSGYSPAGTSAIITDKIRNGSGTDQSIVYSVTPTGSNGCAGKQFTVSATIHPEPVIMMKWDDILICSNKQNLFTSYQWLKNDNPLPGASGQYYPTAKKAGTYKVQAIDKNGCSSMSNEISVSGSGSLHVYPNPASRSVILSLEDDPAGTARITFVNTAGMKLREFEVEKTTRKWENEISVDDLDEGNYYLIIMIGLENVYYAKLLIRRD